MVEEVVPHWVSEELLCFSLSTLLKELVPQLMYPRSLPFRCTRLFHLRSESVDCRLSELKDFHVHGIAEAVLHVEELAEK